MRAATRCVRNVCRGPDYNLVFVHGLNEAAIEKSTVAARAGIEDFDRIDGAVLFQLDHLPVIGAIHRLIARTTPPDFATGVGVVDRERCVPTI